MTLSPRMHCQAQCRDIAMPTKAGMLMQMSTGAAAFLQKGNKLKKLSLFANQLGDDGATEIADALSAGSFVHLQELDLSANSIGSQGVQRLLDVLETQAAPALEVGSLSPLWLAFKHI